MQLPTLILTVNDRKRLYDLDAGRSLKRILLANDLAENCLVPGSEEYEQCTKEFEEMWEADSSMSFSLGVEAREDVTAYGVASRLSDDLSARLEAVCGDVGSEAELADVPYIDDADFPEFESEA